MNPIWILTFAIGVVGANSLVLSPIAVDVAQVFPGATAPDVLNAAAAYGLGTAAGALVLAPRADVFGLRKALVVALGVLAGMLFVSAFAPMLWVLVAAQAIAGCAAGVALPATYGLAADLAPKGQESATLGKVLTGWTLSLVAGVSLAALVSDYAGWRMVFVGLAAASAVLALALTRGGSQDRPPAGAVTSPITALKVPGLFPLLLNVVCFMAAFYGLYAYLGTHMTLVLGTSTTVAGIAALSYGVGFGVVAPLDRLIDRYGARQSAPLIFGLLALIYVALSVVSSTVGGLLIVCLFWGMINHVGLNIMVGQLTALDPARRAAIMGLYSATTYVAMFLGTATFRFMFEGQGFGATAMISAICIVPAALYSWVRRNQS